MLFGLQGGLLQPRWSALEIPQTHTRSALEIPPLQASLLLITFAGEESVWLSSSAGASWFALRHCVPVLAMPHRHSDRSHVGLRVQRGARGTCRGAAEMLLSAGQTVTPAGTAAALPPSSCGRQIRLKRGESPSKGIRPVKDLRLWTTL